MARDLIDELQRSLVEESESELPVEFRKDKLVCFVVDDESDIRRFVSVALKRLGHEVEEFAFIETMVEGLLRRHPDLIFLDISLERSDAVDAIRALGQSGYGGAVQLMSGRAADLIEQVKTVGSNRGLRMLPILAKPFRTEEIRNVIHRYHHPINEVAVGRQAHPQQLEPSPRIELREALHHRWLELWYQPKADLRAKIIVGAEGLVRARHPVHGVLAPTHFLPGADEGSLLALTEFVLATALRDWRILAGSDQPMRIAVNAPMSALTKLSIPALVEEHRPKTPRWPGLIIEITEDEIVRDIPLAHEIAIQLSLYNISLAIDDFGAGYSSFARLRALPFCELKLDGSFVTNCATDRTNEGITQTIIDLAHRFGRAAVAEGIEKKADLQALHKMGCDMGQGNLIAEPMEKEELAAIVLAAAMRRAS